MTRKNKKPLKKKRKVKNLKKKEIEKD